MKTPKEKSEELIKKFISISQRCNIEYVNSKNIEDLKEELFQLEWFIPKECAIICIEEKIKYAIDLLCFFTNESPMYDIIKSSIDRQIEIKQEIEKL